MLEIEDLGGHHSRHLTHDNAYHSLNPATIDTIRQALLDWFDGNKRVLPWRDTAGVEGNVLAYRVLVSEVMLQQTQVSTVIPYYERFLAKFPTISHLAQACLDDVLCVWAGLGYYRRARYLYKAARYIKVEHDGIVPRNPQELLKVPGVGRYTCGAILSIAFDVPAAAVDGNVARILARLRALDTPRHDALWKLATDLAPPVRAGDFTQALFDFGSSICTARAPKCGDGCFLNEACLAFREQGLYERSLLTTSGVTSVTTRKAAEEEGEERKETLQPCTICTPGKRTDYAVTYYPVKPPKKPPREEHKIALILQRDDTNNVLLHRPCPSPRPTKRSQEPRKAKKRDVPTSSSVLSELWELPVISIQEASDVARTLSPNMTITASHEIGSVTHMFSHIHQVLQIRHVTLNMLTRAPAPPAPPADTTELWVKPGDLLAQGVVATSERSRKVIRFWLNSTGPSHRVQAVPTGVKKGTRGSKRRSVGDAKELTTPPDSSVGQPVRPPSKRLLRSSLHLLGV